jgi:hypothetical protein
MEQYIYEDIMSTNVPWPVLYMDGFMAGIVLCFSLAVLSFVFFLLTLDISLISFSVFFVFSGITMGFVHTYASRFDQIIKALGFDFIDVKTEKWNTLMFETNEYGDFTFKYDIDGKNRGARYKVWIITKKNLPADCNKWLDNGDRDVFYKRTGKEETTPLSGYVTPSDVVYIKSLREIRFERGYIAHRIIATLDDLWFYSETPDILRTLKLIRRINGKLDGESRPPRKKFCSKSRNPGSSEGNRVENIISLQKPF